MTCSTSRSSLRRALALGAALATAAPIVPARAAPVPAESKRAAEIALQAGQAFRAKRYEEAAKLFLEAYRLSLRPAQLRNAARAFEEGELLDEAGQHWARYRDHAGISADERAEAEAHVKLIAERKRNAEILRAAEAARAAAEGASAAAEAARKQMEAARAAEAARLTAPAPDRPAPIASYALIGGGALAAGVGTVLWFVASSQLDDVDARLAERDAQDRITGISRTELESEVSGINTMRVLSGVLFSAGIAAAASGVVWLFLDDGPEAPGGPRIEPSAGGAALSF